MFPQTEEDYIPYPSVHEVRTLRQTYMAHIHGTMVQFSSSIVREREIVKNYKVKLFTCRFKVGPFYHWVTA